MRTDYNNPEWLMSMARIIRRQVACCRVETRAELMGMIANDFEARCRAIESTSRRRG